MTKQVFHNNLLLKRGEIERSVFDEIRIFKVNIIHLLAIKLLAIVLLNGT